MNRLRIAMVTSSDSSQIGGIQEHVYYVSHTLEKLGHRVTVYGTPKPLLRYPRYRAVGEAYYVPSLSGNTANMHIVFNDAMLALARHINTHFDICHIQTPYVPFLSWGLLANVSIPKIVSFHLAWEDMSPLNVIRPFMPLVQNIFSSRVNGIIYVSKITKKRWQPMCSKAIPSKIIYNGIDHGIYVPAKNVSPQGTRLLFVGRLVQRKGLMYLLKAMRELVPATNVRLTIVGEGELRSELEHYVELHGLRDHVRFAGQVVGDQKAKYYQEADIFCAPYEGEAFSIAILEAMSSGLPVVGFQNASFREVFRKYPAPKLLVKSQDTRSLARAIRQLAGDCALRKKLRAWALQESSAYSWESVAKQTEAFYDERRVV